MGAYGIPGDPAEMRALAAVLAAEASRLGSTAAGLAPQVSRLDFEGPAATAFAERQARWELSVAGEVAELQDLAARLNHAAAQVEAEQAAAARAAREREEQAAQAMARR